MLINTVSPCAFTPKRAGALLRLAAPDLLMGEGIDYRSYLLNITRIMDNFTLRKAIKGHIPPDAVCAGENMNGTSISSVS